VKKIGSILDYFTLALSFLFRLKTDAMASDNKVLLAEALNANTVFDDIPIMQGILVSGV
jgi:hypothetical protein